MSSLAQIKSLIPKIDEKYRYYILGGVLVLILLIDFFLIMSPQLNTLRTLGPKIKQQAADIQSAKQNIQNINKFQNDLNRLREEVKVANRKIASKEEVPGVLDGISRLATKSGVKIEQLMPVQSAEETVLKDKEGKYVALPVQVDVRSTYHNFGRFLNELERGEVFMNVTEFSFASDAVDPLRHAGRMTIKIVYFEKTE